MATASEQLFQIVELFMWNNIQIMENEEKEKKKKKLYLNIKRFQVQSFSVRFAAIHVENG